MLPQPAVFTASSDKISFFTTFDEIFQQKAAKFFLWLM
jgi:hypothetical protein